MRVIFWLSILLAPAYAVPAPQHAERVYFERVVINNVQSEGSMYPIDEKGLRAKLAKQFDEWIARSVPGNHLANSAEPLADKRPGKGEYVLKTVQNIPLTHRADFSHFSNEFRRGKFMDFTMTLLDSKGKVVATAASNLVWGDGNWYVGAGRTRKSVDHDEVMKSYVRKAVDRGVSDLAHQLKK